jgi:hypothetical protein
MATGVRSSGGAQNAGGTPITTAFALTILGALILLLLLRKAFGSIRVEVGAT